MLKRSGPVALVVAGALLLLGSAGYLLYARALANPGAAAVPEAIAGMPLSQKTVGVEAVAEVTRLHGKEFPLTSGAMAMYGQGAATLWVSGTAANPLAAGMVRAMTDKIADASAGSARSPFTPLGERQMSGRTVYELSGMGQRHFYFQSSNLVIWLAVDETIAENALDETLQFYP
ncbi:MAG: hypothetical protein AAB342_03630 [Chloroflexota bacterium]